MKKKVLLENELYCAMCVFFFSLRRAQAIFLKMFLLTELALTSLISLFLYDKDPQV